MSKKPQEERPLECSECRKPTAVRYTTVQGREVTTQVMCADCPQLELKLRGTEVKKKEALGESAGLCCGVCGTNLEQIRRGGELGCAICYEVFGDVLVKELNAAGKIPKRMTKSGAGHIGRIPGEHSEMTPSVRLIALNAALDDTLKREDYEQAAVIRDQIKEIEKESERG